MAKDNGKPLSKQEVKEAARRTERQALHELRTKKISLREYWEGKR